MLIVLKGKEGSGKTTIAKMLKRAGFKKESFGNKPNGVYKSITGIDFRQLSREKKEQERARFIEFAEGCKGIFGNDVWVKRMKIDPSVDTVVEDLRFHVEYRFLEQYNPIVVHVERLEVGKEITVIVGNTPHTLKAEVIKVMLDKVVVNTSIGPAEIPLSQIVIDYGSLVFPANVILFNTTELALKFKINKLIEYGKDVSSEMLIL